MRRKIYDKLLQWKQEKNGKTALMIEGARRVGKSYIALELACKKAMRCTQTMVVGDKMQCGFWMLFGKTYVVLKWNDVIINAVGNLNMFGLGLVRLNRVFLR